MKIIIDGVEYIATPVGKDCMWKGAREIAHRYNECPEFFDELLKKGFAYYRRDDEAAYDVWATDDGAVFYAPDLTELAYRDEDDRCFEINRYQDVRGWNIQEFQDNLQETNCIVRYNAITATTMLLKDGAAATVAELSGCGQLKEVDPSIKFVVTIK